MQYNNTIPFISNTERNLQVQCTLEQQLLPKIGIYDWKGVQIKTILSWTAPSVKLTLKHNTDIGHYNHEQRDRSGGRGGSVAVYIRDEIPYSRRTDLENEHLEEDLWIEITFPCSKGILLETIYRPPDNASNIITTSIQRSIESAQDEDK